MILILLYTLLIAIFFYLKRRGKGSFRSLKYLNSYNWTSRVLVLLIVIGFVLNLDYTDQWGCIIISQPIFETYNVLFSATALIMTFSAILANKKEHKALIHTCELVFWIGKLIIFKGGYVVGFTASPEIQIVLYDFIALFFRLISIRNTGYKFRTIYLSHITLVIILVKVYVFPTQQTLIWEHEKSLKNSEYTLEKLQGFWSGIKVTEEIVKDTIVGEIDSTDVESLLYMLSKDTLIKDKRIEKYDSVYLSFDSSIMNIEIRNKQLNYFLSFNSEFNATMYEFVPDSIEGDTKLLELLNSDSEIKNNWRMKSEMYIRKIDNDSLIFDEGIMLDENKFILRKNTPANKPS